MTIPVHIRPFRAADYTHMVAIANALFPETPRALDDIRRRDDLWDHARFDLLRVVAETANGTVVGWGQLNHLPHQFEPGRYRIGIQVDPGWQRRGVGTRIYAYLLEALHERGAETMSARARGDLTESITFLEHRGFVPVEDTWESTMRTATFDPERSRVAEARLAAQGIGITSLAVEGAHNPAVLHRVYQLYLACLRDIPTVTSVTDVPFDQFITREVDAPNALPEAHFLAIANDNYVAMCNFVRDPGQATTLAGRMTGCLPGWRGNGIVTALKLRMARFAVEAGFDTIRTWNSATNTPMLRINDAIGFVRHSRWVTFHQDLSARREGTHR